MTREEIERQARSALAAAGNLASRGVEWMKNYRESHCESRAHDAMHDGGRCIYGVTNLTQQSTGFRAFNAFRLMITPMLIRIIWLIGAYIVFPITMISMLNNMSRSRYFSAGDMWKAVGVNLLALLLFRLALELIMAIFRIHESSTKMTELVGRLVRLEEQRASITPKGTGNGEA